MMDSILVFLRQTFARIDVVGAIVALLATLLASLPPIFVRILDDRFRRKRESAASEALRTRLKNDYEAHKGTPQQKMREHLDMRMDEAYAHLHRYEREVAVHRWSNNLLVFGQYVVGVALTSSFLQSTLTPAWIGLLGLIVLMTTTIHERYRPDLRTRLAYEKATQLRSSIRSIEDDLAINEKPDAGAIIKHLSQTLNTIDTEELSEQMAEEKGSENEETEVSGAGDQVKPQTSTPQ